MIIKHNITYVEFKAQVKGNFWFLVHTSHIIRQIQMMSYMYI